MKNPKAQKHDDIEIACAMLSEKDYKLAEGEIAGDPTEVGMYGSKDGIEIYSEEELIISSVELYEVVYEPETGNAERNFKDGTKNKINPETVNMKEVEEHQESLGKVQHYNTKVSSLEEKRKSKQNQEASENVQHYDTKVSSLEGKRKSKQNQEKEEDKAI